MESVFELNMTEILAFALIFLRLTAFIIAMPIFGVGNVPANLKVLMALILSFIIFPQIGWKKLNVDLESMAIITLAVKEMFIGFAFGFMSRMFFHSISMAGQLMSISLGVSAAQLFDPHMSETSSSFDQFFSILAILFFLTLNGHHWLISGLMQTYSLVPITKMTISFEGLRDVAPLVQTITALALKMCAPLLVAILFTNVAMALVGRAVPQLNILITSLPVNVMAGLFVVFISLPLMVWQMRELLVITTEQVFQIVKSF